MSVVSTCGFCLYIYGMHASVCFVCIYCICVYCVDMSFLSMCASVTYCVSAMHVHVVFVGVLSYCIEYVPDE